MLSSAEKIWSVYY